MPGFCPVGVFLEEGRNNIDVLVDLLMVRMLLVLLLILLKLLLLLISHVINLTLVGGVGRGGKGERWERRRVSCLAVLLLTTHEVEREAVGVVVIHF